ncbi:DUF3141 domain-containing protein [Burkholderia ubonensis]|uniref:DUF3141 domain-containing protein n=1 Tax=Burkholderia ubonensis TaxID=101571 RepID=UPI0009B3375E|nr:DUF3141 domain-containing protein [Burkholderia ubonensis]
MSDVTHAVPSPVQCAQDAIEYGIDAWQRSVLLLDVLRERGNIYLDHARYGKPPVLAFEYEVIMDGRALPQPANYALARVIPADGPDEQGGNGMDHAEPLRRQSPVRGRGGIG